MCSKDGTAHIETVVAFENHSPVSATKTSWWSTPTNALCSWFSVKVTAEATCTQPLTFCFSSVPGREGGDKERLLSHWSTLSMTALTHAFEMMNKIRRYFKMLVILVKTISMILKGSSTIYSVIQISRIYLHVGNES